MPGGFLKDVNASLDLITADGGRVKEFRSVSDAYLFLGELSVHNTPPSVQIMGIQAHNCVAAGAVLTAKLGLDVFVSQNAIFPLLDAAEFEELVRYWDSELLFRLDNIYLRNKVVGNTAELTFQSLENTYKIT